MRRIIGALEQYLRRPGRRPISPLNHVPRFFPSSGHGRLFPRLRLWHPRYPDLRVNLRQIDEHLIARNAEVGRCLVEGSGSPRKIVEVF